MISEKFKCKLQRPLLQHFLSRALAKVADCKIGFIKDLLIKTFIFCYKIDISIAASSELSAYNSFNAFFIRALKKEARPICTDENSFISPADGTLSESGSITEGKLYQTKGHFFNLIDLLGGDQGVASKYLEGDFLTIYLAPHNYHRVHMPLSGQLLKTIYIPGTLFSVNNRSVAKVPNLFCRNERLICFFETDIGEIAVILVGAMLVAGIETVWGQRETPCGSKQTIVKHYQGKNIYIEKGMEFGHFQYGSTVILLFPPNTVELANFIAKQTVTMGSPLGHVIKKGR